MISTKTKQVEERRQAAASVNKSLLSIDYASKKALQRADDCAKHRFLENLETMDYMAEGDVGFKKPKVSLFSELFYFTSSRPPDKKETSFSPCTGNC